VQMMLTKQLHADAAAAAQIYSGIPCTLCTSLVAFEEHA
jgi:hypothetical protein